MESKNRSLIKNRKNVNSVFVFDLDGVIVDTLSSLYRVYLEFLGDLGIKGNNEEFNQLNGPSLTEIISFLKEKYHLSQGKEELLERYDQKIKESYITVVLIDGAEEILKLLKNRGFSVALASSSKERNIQFILNKFNLNQYFDFVVSGDEVTTSKPSPEIYHLVRDKFCGRNENNNNNSMNNNNNNSSNEYKFYVIEDSFNGLKSAISAGMEGIHFNPSGQTVEVHPSYTISEMKEMENIVLEIETSCKIEALSSEFEVKVKALDLDLSPEQEQTVNEIWTEETGKNHKLFNGQIISYLSHHFEGSVLVIESFVTEYKYFLAKLRDVSLDIKIIPLAVSGIIFDQENNILVARRESVTEYKDSYEFLPSGGISVSSVHRGIVSFEDQLREEFAEETGMSKAVIKEIQPFCFILDRKHQVYDICCQIFLQTSLKEEASLKEKNNLRREYSIPEIVSSDHLLDFVNANIFVPTSIAIARILENKFRQKKMERDKPMGYDSVIFSLFLH